MHNSKLKQITVALCLALLPLSVFAAGLGKLNVNSGLGEPLKADIELLSVSSEDLNSINAVIASEEAYTLQGIEKPASHNTIKIEISKNASGAPILKLKSSQPISEPFLDMLIQVDWASGRLLREYTVLLDPPGYAGEVVSEPASQNKQTLIIKPNNSANDSQIPNGTNSVKKSQPRIRNKPAFTPAPQSTADEALPAEASQNYTTQRGDSLAAIAQRLKPENVNLDRMLVGLYQANPDAFDANNMNRLKVGKILRQPSEQELSSISSQAASKEIKMQASNWNAYRNKLAGIVAQSPATNVEANAQSVAGKIKSAAEDQSVPAANGTKDVVKLSAGGNKSDQALESTDLKELQAKITALQEENIAREKSIIEAQSRTVALEKQIEDMQKLLTIKNAAMADMQNQSTKDNVTPETVTNNIENAEIKNSTPVVTTIEPPFVKPAADSKQAVNDPMAAVMPETGSNVLDGLDLPLLGTIGAALILLGGAWMFLRNKRKINLANFEQGIMTSGGLKANTVFGNTSGSRVDTGDTSFLTDFSQSAHGGMIDTNDVDPIAEAEVYMAYGRDAQAEEILKDAITKEPKRYELHLKLLEMYATTKNFSAFETIAGELYTSLGADDPIWAKVAEIGNKLEPTNPLYQAKTASGNSNASYDTSTAELAADDFSNVPVASETDLDFSFDNDSLVKNFASPSTLNAQELDDTKPQNQFDELPEFDFKSSPSEIASFAGNNPQVNDISDVSDIVDLNAIETKNDESLDFDFGDFESDSSEMTDSNNTVIANEIVTQDINFSAFEISKQEELPKTATANIVSTNDGDFNDLDFNFDGGQQLVNTDESEFYAADANNLKNSTSDFDIPTLENFETDSTGGIKLVDENTAFNNFELSEIKSNSEFDIDNDEEKIAASSVEQIDSAKTFDFSDISLDFNDDKTDEPSNTFESNDPVEIETKLSLVLAYIEMDDLEGAKEMLDEVMSEGSESQRLRAQEIATKLV